MRYLAIATLLVLAPLSALAQQVRQDPATGNYFVVVYNDDLQPVEILVEVADRVEYSVVPVVTTVGAAFQYRYEVRVDADSPQPLRTIQVDCPEPTSLISGLSAATTYQGAPRALNVRHNPWAGLPSCMALLGAAPLQPGADLTLAFESPLLPVVGEARGLGAVTGVSWPTSDPIEENDAAREFVRSVQGRTGGWKAIPAVVPARDPASLEPPSQGLALIRQDLAEACALGWIANPGICNSLDAKLGAAAQSLDGGQTGAARGSLRAFLSELDAQHGDQPGKHIGDNAYALLGVNVEYLLSLIPIPPPTVTAALNPVAGKSLKHNKGTFTVAFACEEGAVTSATLNEVDVEDGDVVVLSVKSQKSKKSKKSGKTKDSTKSLKLEGPSFLLTVVCENASGTVTATASPDFPEKSTKDKGD